MSNRILITGASGLIATTLAKRLTELGFECVFLSANKRRKGEQNYFYWNISTGELDERCLDGVDSIVHLAGAGISDKAWTTANKKENGYWRSGSTAQLHEKFNPR
ncbi:MAG: NAD-dependent epimerase/dehydratase family protein, partial [Bacteroidia bacterium]